MALPDTLVILMDVPLIGIRYRPARRQHHICSQFCDASVQLAKPQLLTCYTHLTGSARSQPQRLASWWHSATRSASRYQAQPKSFSRTRHGRSSGSTPTQHWLMTCRDQHITPYASRNVSTGRPGSRPARAASRRRVAS